MHAWHSFLDELEHDFGADTVNAWLRPLKIINFDACNLYLEAKDSFQVLWFEEHVRPHVLKKFINNNHKHIKVHLKVAEKQSVAQAQSPPKNRELIPQKTSFEGNFITDSHSFENFLVSDANNLAHRLLDTITSPYSESQDVTLGSFNPIFLHGPSGTGKTHLMIAAAQRFRQQNCNFMYVKADAFVEHAVRAIRSADMQNFRATYRNIDILLVDDIQILSNKSATQEEFFHTFNTLHIARKQIILSADHPPSELKGIEPRLISRFEWGILVPLEPLEASQWTKLAEMKAKELHLMLAPSAIEFLTLTFHRNTKNLIKALEAASLRLHLKDSLRKHNTPITDEQLKPLLMDLVNLENTHKVTSEKIIEHVAMHYGVRMKDLMGKTQSREYTLPRQVAMYLCRTQLKMPYKQIGEMFERDHSTVISSYKLIEKHLTNQDPSLSYEIPLLVKKVNYDSSSAEAPPEAFH